MTCSGPPPTTSLAATLTIVIGFLLWGLAIGQLYQDLYARVWRIHVGSVADQLLFTIWFFVTSGLIALMTVSAANLRSHGWLVLVPAWIAGSTIFWLWTPRFLLHRKIPLRSLLPGALLAAFVLGGTVATSPLWIGPTIDQNARAFGPFGAVLALFAYVLIVITISMACAVFSPVWAEWRQAERDRREQPATLETADERPPRRPPSPSALVAEHRLEAVEALCHVVETSLDPLDVLRLVGGFSGVLKARRPRDEGGGDRGGHDRDEGDRFEHDGGCDDPSRERLRRDVAVADGRHGLDRPPHADEDVRVLTVVENPHE